MINNVDCSFQYQPPRLPDQGVYQLLGDPSVILSAIEGDMEPLREAIDRIPMTMPDVMRYDSILTLQISYAT